MTRFGKRVNFCYRNTGCARGSQTRSRGDIATQQSKFQFGSSGKLSKVSTVPTPRAPSADPAQSTAESHTTPRELAMSITSPFSDLYEPIDVIGNGSFGIIRKVRRKQDGVVSNPF